jgi:heme/copper-type cytochrome/quinol oxidase subunit 3
MPTEQGQRRTLLTKIALVIVLLSAMYLLVMGITWGIALVAGDGESIGNIPSQPIIVVVLGAAYLLFERRRRRR